MEWDDIIYLSLLFSCIGFGHFLRQIKNKESRKWVATIFGFIIVLIASGRHILHPLLTVLVNALIIMYGNKRSIHVFSFGFTFAYLIFFRTTEYFGIPYPPSHTNLIQMILTLKLVGLAFEVHDTAMAEKVRDSSDDSPQIEVEASRVAPPSLLDIFHYSFCYIGVLTGPYFKYRMYWDMFNSPFAELAPCTKATLERIMPVPLWAGAFLLSSYVFPLKYALSDEFYTERSMLYRLWYLYPSFFNFRMRMYIGMRLSECVFTMSGLGAYPAVTEPKPGQGPSTEFFTLGRIAASPELAQKEQYSFAAIYNIDAWGSDFQPTIRSSMKAWNMTIQHWLAVNVYKRFPVKSYRMPVTFVVSSLWHGVYAGYYLCLCSVPFYLPAEDMFYKAFRNNTLPPGVNYVWAFFRYWWKMLHFSYWSMAFSLLRIDACLRYWSSIYFLPNILTVVMYVIGLTILKPSRLPTPPK
ncbi:lysophospholipid acyltransferase 7-like isoform X1 [Homalodisca vitripennis]|uniref:lysophospholipid acyltransferase 7-like isoform X1 n=2 Tax=Homalodisca vitripennis TaxID=197043 RepID=UPI001EE9C013|nr:lysophospholipid acyltransferase 7-like isoform X1 [Homalodisca vitripennis]